MRSDVEVILDSLVELTEQRQLESLSKSLVSTVEQFIDPINVQFFNVRLAHGACDEIVLPDEFSPNAAEYDADERDQAIHGARCFIECVQSRSTSCSFGMLPAQIFIPIILNDSVVKVLWVKLVLLSDESTNLLKSLAKVYENFLSIVIECETDGLTGLLNRKGFERRLKQSASNVAELNSVSGEQAKRHWLCIFDIDKFKNINDTFGHLYGDEILLDLVKVMGIIFTKHDAMFRFGGDEFVMLLAPQTKDEMITTCTRFQSELFSFHGQKMQVTVSMGVTQVLSGEQASSLLAKADLALYHIKETGRNRVEVYEELLSRGALVEKTFDDDIELF